ncbi:hypothetical protein FG386_000474, partial [Cryptosporidium ryanae]|uniref:uncharacterized protein n=1 Tax=Cryptosporidium ryanae TaxID=515981 RepID=UPI00351A50FE
MRWKGTSLLLVFLFITIAVNGKIGESNYYFFKKAHSTSTLVGTAFNGEYDPVNALNMGNGEWRSAKDLSVDQQIVFTAEISATAKAIGLKIVWSSSPAESQIQVSPDGINYEIVVPNRKSTQDEKEFTENFMFNHTMDLRSVKVQMKAGTGIGVTKLDLNGTATSTINALHTLDAAIDKDIATYWASVPFDKNDENKILINLSTNGTYQLKNLRIDWEFPPFTYSISAKVDGQMKEVVKVEGNPSNTTLNEMNGVISDFIQIVMEKPHPRYGKYSDKY